MIGASAEHAGAPPDPIGTRGVGVGLAGNFPAADERSIESAPFVHAVAGSAMRDLIGPGEHFGLLGAIEPLAGFEQADLGAGVGEDLRGDTAAGPGAHYDDVVGF